MENSTRSMLPELVQGVLTHQPKEKIQIQIHYLSNQSIHSIYKSLHKKDMGHASASQKSIARNIFITFKTSETGNTL